MARIVSDDEVRELLEPFGGEDAVLESMRKFQENREYLEANRERLKQQFPDQWVVILRQQVVAHGDDPDDILNALQEAGEDLQSAVVHQACVEEPVWLLAAGSRCRA